MKRMGERAVGIAAAAALAAGGAAGCDESDPYLGAAQCFIAAPSGNLNATRPLLVHLAKSITNLEDPYRDPAAQGLQATITEIDAALGEEYAAHGQPKAFIPQSGDYEGVVYTPSDRDNPNAGGLFDMYETGTVTQLRSKEIDESTRAKLGQTGVYFVQVSCDNTTMVHP